MRTPTTAVTRRTNARALGLALVLLPLLFGAGLADDASVLLPNGALEAPRQAPIAAAEAWSLGDYTVTPLAEYDVTGRVLSQRTYDSGREAETSPIDFALGWGPMADEEILSAYEVSQRDRWYYVRWNDSPLPREAIIESSANTHLLPASPELRRRLEEVRPGQVVHLRGYLVEVAAEDGWRWRSSLHRDDTGDGACEVLWVEAVEVVDPLPTTTATR